MRTLEVGTIGAMGDNSPQVVFQSFLRIPLMTTRENHSGVKCLLNKLENVLINKNIYIIN